MRFAVLRRARLRSGSRARLSIPAIAGLRSPLDGQRSAPGAESPSPLASRFVERRPMRVAVPRRLGPSCGALPCQAWAVCHRACDDDAAPNRPTEQPMQMAMAAAGERDRASISDGVNQVQNWRLADLGNPQMPPCRQHLPVQDALDLIVGAVVGLIALQPICCHAGEIIGGDGRGRHNRLQAARQPLARLAPRIAGLRQFHRWPRAKGQPLLLALPAIEVHPGAAAAVGDAQSEPWISGVEVVDLASDGRLDSANPAAVRWRRVMVSAVVPEVTIGNKHADMSRYLSLGSVRPKCSYPQALQGEIHK